MRLQIDVTLDYQVPEPADVRAHDGHAVETAAG